MIKAVWLVRSRDISLRARFWISIVGYDPTDRSIRQAIYYVYVAIFFTLWGFAVLALLSDGGALVLGLLKGLAPTTAAVAILTGVLLLLMLTRAYQSAKRSPFVFSESDAELICQAPVPRGHVALAWFLGDWFFNALVFIAVAVVLRFASLQMSAPGGFAWAHLPRYLLAGLQVSVTVIPLNMAVIALAYALGALRLNPGREYRWLRWVPLDIAALFGLIVIWDKTAVQVVFWLVLFPLQAAFGSISWYLGFIYAVVMACACLLLLYRAAGRMNLSQAAQETRDRFAFAQAALLGDASLTQDMLARQKLGVWHAPSRLPARGGIYSLVWKASVVAVRLPKTSLILSWLGLFALSLGLLLTPDWGSRLWAFVFWCLMVAQLCTANLRADLHVWSLLRQLPFSARKLVLAESLVPAILATFLGGLSYAISYRLGVPPPLYILVFLPPAILGIGLSASLDVLRHCHASELLTAQVPGVGAGGLLLGIILAGLPIVLVSWLLSLVHSPIMGLLVTSSGFTLAMAAVLGVWHWASRTYSHIG